jgi:hypothetical protein
MATTLALENSWHSCEPRTLEGRTIEARPASGHANRRTLAKTFEEMLETVEHLETVSNPGTPCPTSRRPQLKRMLLEKTKCHLYFVSDERKQRIDVLHVWDGRRERLPSL